MILRFGTFEFDLETRELHKSGLLVRLPPQASRVLVLLVSKPGEMVTRSELRGQVWGSHTFVDFEQGLNRCIKQIRTALRDNAQSPRYVETLARRGYRFINPVESNGRRVYSPRKPSDRKLLLAVLPFHDLRPQPELEQHFSDGMTEEMIVRLGLLSPQNLAVIARTSVMKYQNTDKGVAEIAHELGVDYVLEGSVRRCGERLRITAQLIQPSNQTCLWARSYERGLTDVFAVQTQVAMDIARSLAVELLPAPIRPVFSPHFEAYEHYLKGRYYWNKRTEDGLQRGIRHFGLAIESEPLYARAYAGLADCYTMLGWNGMLSPGESFPKAKAAACKALEIDPELADAHTSLAVAKLFYDWDWRAAEEEFKRAIALDPNYSVVRPWYAFEMSALGRHAEAAAEKERAWRLDPLSVPINTGVGMTFYLARRYDEAIEQCRKTIEMDSNFSLAHFVLGCTYALKGMHSQAAAELETAVNLSGHTLAIGALGYVCALSGDRNRARRLLRQLIERSEQRYVSPSNIATIHVGLGEKELALDWLQKAYEVRTSWLILLNVNPMFDSLRSEPRFRDLVRRIGLVPGKPGGSGE